MQEPTLISTFNKSNRFLTFVLLISLFAFTVLLFKKYNYKDLTTFGYLVGGILLSFGLLLIVREIYRSPKMIFYKDRVELFYFLNLKKETINFAQIEKWTKRKITSKNSTYEILYLILKDNRVLKFKSYYYDNYYSIKLNLRNGKSENLVLKKQIEKKLNKIVSITFFAIGLIILGVGINFYDNNKLIKDNLATVKGHLSEGIELTHSRRSRSLNIRLIEYPAFKFQIGSLALKETYAKDLMNDYNSGEEIQFEIEKSEYDKKISHTKKTTFADSVFHFKTINIVQVAGPTFTYLSLANYNEKHHSNNISSSIFFGLFGLLLVFISTMIWRKADRNTIHSGKIKKRK